MCRPRLALTFGRTLKIESGTPGPGNGTALRKAIPAPGCGITCRETGRCVCAFIELVRARIRSCVCMSGPENTVEPQQHCHNNPSLESTVSAFPASCFIL